MKYKNKEEHLGFLIGMTAIALKKKMNHNFSRAGYDITPEQFGLIMHLNFFNGSSQQELAEKSKKDKVCITKLIDSLEKKKLVSRMPDDVDRRIKRIYLAEDVKKNISLFYQTAVNTMEEVTLGIPMEEIEALKSTLKKIYKNIVE